jgi:hypothetical protein
MKKLKMFFLFLSAVYLFTGCFGNNNDTPPVPVLAEKFTNTDNRSADGFANTVRLLANEAAVEAAFTLDYRPQRAEPENEAEVLSAEALSGVVAEGSGWGTIVGGGLRRLSDYRTVYFDPVRERNRIQEIRAAQEVSSALQFAQLPGDADAGELTVIDWGPRGNFSAAVQRPSIFVIFSQPMVPLASLGEPSAASPIVNISPPIRGTFRWYGTSFLSFEAEEPCQSQQTYTITVAANATSVNGVRISGERVFSFHTESLSIRNVIPGEEYRRRTNFRFNNNNVPPDAAREIGLLFNYPVLAADINQHLEITTGNAPDFVQKRFTLKQDNEYRITAELLDTVDFDTQVRIVLKAGARSGGGTRGTEADQVFSFRTPGPFHAVNHRRFMGHSRHHNFIEIQFSHALDESSLRNAFTMTAGQTGNAPTVVIGDDNIQLRGNTVRLVNLPVNFGDRFNVQAAASIEDLFGRKLRETFSFNVVMPDEPPPMGHARFLDYRRHVMLEAQFPPRYLFEYTNIAGNSWYQLAAISNPWASPIPQDAVTIPLQDEPNVIYYEDIDLLPYLNEHGRGFVAFHANMHLLTNRQQNDGTFIPGSWELKNDITIQVTDLGMTVRFGFNRAVVMVTSLSTGKPVEGATVKLLSPVDVSKEQDLSAIPHFGEAVTDKNGLAVLPMRSLLLRSNTVNSNSWRGFSEPFVMAEKDGDKAIFTPFSHNIWRYDVMYNIPQRAEEITPVTFMFTDRGLYKPGETLTFRGVDRSMILGMYAIYNGEYTIILEEDNFSPVQVTVLQGTTSESGTFYGTINIPDDLMPGSYRLIYRRNDGISGDENIANIPVTVAFFERLMFQASLSAPAAPVLLGDNINLNLRATYLSGGSLSGTSWEGAWFEEMTVFTPGRADTRDFVFGPRRAWDSKRHIASDNGVLSGQGTATLSQRTGGAKVTGAPYIYQAEARVTDISNQMITAFRSVVVHPASFYIGLSNDSSGFARAGQEISFNYITVNPAGERITANNIFLQSGEDAGQLRVELIREDWRRIQQRGVNGHIYDEYSPHNVTDSEQRIAIRREGGSFRVRPSSAGFHILRVSSKDREGRTALTEYTFFVTGSGGFWNMSNPNEIRLIPDQEMYEPGDVAKVMLQSTLPQGYYLITVEREGIFTEEVRHFTEPVTVIDIPIARNFVPVVYVSVSSYSVRSGPPVHQYGNPDLDKPRDYFGITQLNINHRVRAFSVSIETDKKTYRPGEEVTMTLTATRGGRPLPDAELTLMAVDRGVLDLINYHVPDPIRYFYSQRNFGLSVSGGDSRSWLMDPVTYSVKNLAGGDSFANGESKMEERKDFNPTAVFEPMLITDSNGRVTHTFRLPDNLTTYRVTVFGVRGDLFALKESEIAAQNRINVREVLPRRVRERDTAEAGVLITNLDTSAHTITVRLDVGAPLPNNEQSGLIKTPGQAFVDGTVERRVTVRSGENAVVYFDVAAARAGTVTLNFTVNSQILNERLIREMIIEQPFVMETVTTTGTIEGSSAREGVVIPSFADNGTGSLTVSLDATRLSLLDSAISYLFRYPFGCLEQRSSAIMPLVIFGEYLDALSIKTEVSNPHRVVENEFRSWAQIQLTNGGFAAWPSGTRADFYTSLRIAHTIAIAREKNINIPSSLNVSALAAYLNREYQNLQRWNRTASAYYYQSYLQSYTLYVLALLGERVDPSRLAEILGRDNIDACVLAFAGMTYRILGRNSDAANTAQRLRNLVRMTTRGADITDPLERHRFNFYGGKIEQHALTLQFFVDQFPRDEINTRLLYSLLEYRRSGMDHWRNTADTVRALTAIDALIRAENLVNTDVTASAALAGTELLYGTFKGLGSKPVTRIFDFTEPVMAGLARDNIQALNFTRNGTGNIYYTASLRYAIPSELQSFRDEGIGVFMTLHDIGTGEEINGGALKSGRTYRARVRVSSTRDRTFVALRVPIPSGGEILDAAFVTTATFEDMGGAGGDDDERMGSWVSHQHILDNEVQYFWDRFHKGETTVSFLFRTARRGVYPTPPAQAECMYEPEIFGRSQGIIYTIE